VAGTTWRATDPAVPEQHPTTRLGVEAAYSGLIGTPIRAAVVIDSGLEPFHPRLFNARFGELHAGSVLYRPLYSTCCLGQNLIDV
jgi:hypothetical protein